ncbi:unnamed protein product [Darwinula stevensoni]|uniref:Beta-galactosidase n=1 Tax=Darwinula stevensoni TaxID=69355 RepID=A0A7R9A210_9CRUS|nr:unnamed protein product [Darwinula stevensoni]CAG0887732.1 unnamed protein product [Darwinula stevensoni]
MCVMGWLFPIALCLLRLAAPLKGLSYNSHFENRRSIRDTFPAFISSDESASLNYITAELPLFAALAIIKTSHFQRLKSSQRLFVVDYENNRFLKDGKPYRYVSGSMHYMRIPRIHWRDRLLKLRAAGLNAIQTLLKLRAAGLNAIQTYIQWSLHEPWPGVYDFDGNLDISSYFKEAQDLGLAVIVRLGPYIDAEVDMGGLPFWLLREDPLMKLRTSDPSYMKWVKKWFGVLLPILQPLLYENGGPIIMMQIENEYGSYFACDSNYTLQLRDLTRGYVGDQTVLFTTDGPSVNYLRCGFIPKVFPTIDFGSGDDIGAAFFNGLRPFLPKGPLVNSEYYPGWMDYWGYPHSTGATKAVVHTMVRMLALPTVSVNFYVFHGGTNFGNSDPFRVATTSYDYDAPLTEAGDPTEKYFAIRDALHMLFPGPQFPVPGPTKKYAYGYVEMVYVTSLLGLLSSLSQEWPISSSHPLTFEEICQAYGFVYYETVVDIHPTDPAILNVSEVHDRGYVFVGDKPVGILSRESNSYSMPISIIKGQRLGILVENQGRICYGRDNNDFKVPHSFFISAFEEQECPWTYKEFYRTEDLLSQLRRRFQRNPLPKQVVHESVAFYYGTFPLPSTLKKEPQDSFLQFDGWTRGIAWVNGFNLGRYWPVMGPQLTLYVPKSALRPLNEVILFELEGSPCEQDDECKVQFVDSPILNGSTPHIESPLSLVQRISGDGLFDLSASLDTSSLNPGDKSG